MAKEIERKFLVEGEGWRRNVARKERLRDGIVAFGDGRKVRVRYDGTRATLTVKGPRRGISRDEFEYEIPPGDARVLLEEHCSGEIREKTRHHLFHDGQEWTIDEYHGALSGILLAEIELTSEEARFARPPWLGREISGLTELRRTALAGLDRAAGG
ncbi:CYTH domain-containing protein [Poseidonocella sp. HB161398]|uniref:CYTH domain-containing protein n=1 Tax=Poseidonocella sp. HB161398 TaxID=2320855 RepID=UPI001109FFEB|nr:CYTH domain-containing protein [Poseidonocella sp. HB161398]